jgi:hypothetical protein
MATHRRQRRSSGLIRVPFVQRCQLERDEDEPRDAFLVNINILGAYVADDDPPPVGQQLRCRFHIPGNEIELVLDAVVVWLNGRQHHPVHSLPRGFGMEFKDIPPEAVERLRDVVREYVMRHPPAR